MANITAKAAETAGQAAAKVTGIVAEVTPAFHAPEVSADVTAMFGLLLAGLVAALALEEKLHAKKSIIVGVFALVALMLSTALGLEPFGDVTLPDGHKVSMPIYIPAIDWQVIAIIIGSGVFVDVVSRAGVFSWIAVKLTKVSGGDPLKLLWYYGLMTVAFSAVLNNVTAIIISGSLTVVSLGKLNKKHYILPFMLVEAFLTNVGGLLTLISSVPNIIVGGAAGIHFIEFFIKAAPYVFVSTALTIYMGARVFGIRGLKTQEEKEQAAHVISGFDENDGIHSKTFFRLAVGALCAFILVVAVTSILPGIKDLGIGFVALTFALLMLLKYRHEADKFYQAIDWDLIGFFMGLFVILSVMDHALVLEDIGKGIHLMVGDTESASGTVTLLFSSALFSSVTDNIPLTAMLSKILVSMHTSGESPLWWSVVFGANLGGNLTPIGSASTLVAMTIMNKYGVEISFGAFVVKALPFAMAQIILSALYVLIF